MTGHNILHDQASSSPRRVPREAKRYLNTQTLTYKQQLLNILLYYITLYHVILYYIMLYYIVLYYITLYYITLHSYHVYDDDAAAADDDDYDD